MRYIPYLCFTNKKIMGTKELLIDKLQSELSFKEYQRDSEWFLSHINRIVNDYPFLKIGAKIKAKFDEEQICEVKDFIIYRGLLRPSILVQTDYGNVYYYETKK